MATFGSEFGAGIEGRFGIVEFEAPLSDRTPPESSAFMPELLFPQGSEWNQPQLAG